METSENREQEKSGLFASLVAQQANLAMMLLGKVAHPETGKPIKDLEAARLFIDHLEVLEGKTKGNLTKEESDFLKQSLMALRLAFVEAVDEGGSDSETAKATPAAGATAPAAPDAKPAEQASDGANPPTPSEGHPKKFSKKY